MAAAELDIPEEFSADFRSQVNNRHGLSDRKSRDQFADHQRVQDALEDATFRSAALLEALAALLEFSENSHHPRLSDSAAQGLQLLAFQEGMNLRDRLADYARLTKRQRGLVAA